MKQSPVHQPCLPPDHKESATTGRSFLPKYYMFTVRLTCLLALLACACAKTGFQKVTIIGTNDIHGTAFPTQMVRSDTNESYTYGGLEFMAQMIETIRLENPGNVLWVDAGDQFQGGIEASPLVSSGEIMNDFYNTLKLDASAIGNHEFDFGPSFLLPYWDGRPDGSVNVAANVRSETGREEFLPLQRNSHLVELANGIKIGLIGLTTVETLSTTAAFTDGLFPAYQFLEYAEIVTAQSALLRSNGANAVLILSHVGNDCSADSTFGRWTEDSEQSSTCLSTDEISALLGNLKVGTVDGVIQGHRHKFSHHFIRGVPVMGTINGGYYFNILHLDFYNGQIYNREIEGPVPVCQKIFANTRRCSYMRRDELDVAGELQNWEFHGRQVDSHGEVARLFNTKWLPAMREFLQPLVQNEVYMTRVYREENELANLITDLIGEALPCDFVIVNSGGFRSTWLPGVLQYQHFYNMFPFSNTLVSFEMNGYELIESLKILQAGRKGFYPVRGLKQTVSYSLNGTAKFINATWANGQPIDLATNYRGVSINFLLGGGDDFKDVMGKVYTLRKEKEEGEMRSIMKPKLIERGIIKEGSLIDPLNPRITVLKVA